MKFFLISLFLMTQVSMALPKEKVIKGPNGKKYHTGLIHEPAKYQGLGKAYVKLADCDNLPEAFDLRDLKVVPEIRDQGNCGSCWSFSKTGSLESAILANGGKKVDLSEQELVSCDNNNYGCGGGNLNQSEYQVTHGQGLESDYPYTSGRNGNDGSCKKIKEAAKGTSFAYVGSSSRSPNEQELKCALYKSHTIPWITVSANNNWGSFPSSEDKVYNHCGRGQTNHAVGVVGWKKVNNKTVFIMKNSWGLDFGAKGYGVLPLGCDSFGDEVAYILTDAMPCKPPFFKLPAEVSAYKDSEVMLGVKEEKKVEYTWYLGDKEIGKGPTLYVTALGEKIYKLVGKTSCGTVESSVRVKLTQN